MPESDSDKKKSSPESTLLLIALGLFVMRILLGKTEFFNDYYLPLSQFCFDWEGGRDPAIFLDVVCLIVVAAFGVWWALGRKKREVNKAARQNLVNEERAKRIQDQTEKLRRQKEEERRRALGLGPTDGAPPPRTPESGETDATDDKYRDL